MDEGYVEADERRQRIKKRIFTIGAVLIAWFIVGGGMYSYWYKYGASSEDRFDREVRDDPVAALALDPLQRLFPYEYKRLRLAASENYNVDRHGRVLDHMPSDFIKTFRRRHAYEALIGGSSEKLAFIAAQGALFDAAVKDKHLCHMLAGNEDQMSDMSLVFSKEPFSKMFGALVVVAASGLKDHAPDKPSAAHDFEDFNRAYRKLDPKPALLKPDDEMGACKREATELTALRSLPSDQQVRLVSRVFQLWR